MSDDGRQATVKATREEAALVAAAPATFGIRTTSAAMAGSASSWRLDPSTRAPRAHGRGMAPDCPLTPGHGLRRSARYLTRAPRRLAGTTATPGPHGPRTPDPRPAPGPSGPSGPPGPRGPRAPRAPGPPGPGPSRPPGLGPRPPDPRPSRTPGGHRDHPLLAVVVR